MSDSEIVVSKPAEPVIVIESSVQNEKDVKSEDKVIDEPALNVTTSEDSEYETLEEDNGRSSQSSGSRKSSFSSNEQDEELSDGIALEDEREDGDGQEENSSVKDKKLDDDEDRRNPQYIPKKGTFYEHDDRTMMDENEEERTSTEPKAKEEVDNDSKIVAPKKGKVWTEKADKWSHDLYIEDDQKPKSTQELIDTYGYDIRNEEAPPKARRRRRYGRGPNKYTRNWEDEDAYIRSTPNQRRVFQNNKEDFPDLEEGEKGVQRRRDKGRGKSKSPSQKSPSSPVRSRLRPHTGEKSERGLRREKDERPAERERPKPVLSMREKQLPTPITQLPDKHSLPISNSFPPPPLIIKQEEWKVKEGEQKVGRGRGFRGTNKPRPSMEFIASKGRTILPAAFNKESTNNQVPDSLKHAADVLVQDFSHIYINNNNNNNPTNTNIVEETIIPRSERRSHGHSHGNAGDTQHSGEANVSGSRAKRYSTQRQRSLPETTPPPAYSPPQPHNIPYYTQPPPPPSTAYVAASVYSEVAPTPVTSPPMQLPMGVAFLPPGPPPTASAAPPYPPPPLINFMPPPTFPPMALQPPMAGQFEDLSQAAELYQGQGGITYYSTQTQSALPRPNPPRRIKLAIPIVPPPDNMVLPSVSHKRSNSGDGKQQEVQSAVS